MDKQTLNIMLRALPLVVDRVAQGNYEGRHKKRATGLYKLSGRWENVKRAIYG